MKKWSKPTITKLNVPIPQLPIYVWPWHGVGMADDKLDLIISRLDHIDSRLDHIDTRLDKIDTSIAHMAPTVDALAISFLTFSECRDLGIIVDSYPVKRARD